MPAATAPGASSATTQQQTRNTLSTALQRSRQTRLGVEGIRVDLVVAVNRTSVENCTFGNSYVMLS